MACINIQKGAVLCILHASTIHYSIRYTIQNGFPLILVNTCLGYLYHGFCLACALQYIEYRSCLRQTYAQPPYISPGLPLRLFFLLLLTLPHTHLCYSLVNSGTFSSTSRIASVQCLFNRLRHINRLQHVPASDISLPLPSLPRRHHGWKGRMELRLQSAKVVIPRQLAMSIPISTLISVHLCECLTNMFIEAWW